MDNRAHLRLNAADRSYFALLKKEVAALAATAPFGKKRLAEIDIIVAEMVSNLSKHAGGGEVFAHLIEENGVGGIELLAMDSGPGIADLKAMMQDGSSTKSTLGNGLGAIKRLSDFYQIYTQKNWGTLVLARVFAPKAAGTTAPEAPAEVRWLTVPKPGETACGDGFYCRQNREQILLFLGDGLGHGKEAAKAVQTAIAALENCSEESPVQLLRHIHLAVKKTRGLVATIAVLNLKEKMWKICGVGNISTRIMSPGFVKLHSPYNGIVGLNIPNSMSDQELPYEKGQCITLCSDGLKTKWDLVKFPGLLRYDLSIVNAVLFKELARNTDDMSVASCKLFV